MKSKFLFSLILISLLFSSCLIRSINPFYQKNDVVFDKDLIGKWSDQESAIWHFETYKQDQGKENTAKKTPRYRVSYPEENGNHSYFMVTLFKIDQDYYLDFFPDYETLEDQDFFGLHTMPTHSLAKLTKQSAEDFSILWYNEEWLNELFENKRTDVKSEVFTYDDDDDGSRLLTASTAELQQFIREFGNDPAAFDCDDKMSGDTYCRKLTRLD